ncbi:LuxR C-terminal-related transcriptional regulator [Leifsonia sp. NPDC014704]|uniref:LuxR C-terminal-related transcriptional regulator n=1 Tax=Leifsonia sp. NPDC014704 TaxID=3364123 RepID=UPI0036F45F92
MHAIQRPALFEQLDVGVRGPLTVIVAPAGSGKTALLSQWVASRPHLAVAWFQVTTADRDGARFARRFAAGLTAVHPTVGALHPRSEATGCFGEAFLDDLVAALADAETEIVILIDDVQILQSPELVADLSALADRLPPNAHLILSSRTDAGMRLTHHRLRHSVVEIRQHQLRLDVVETEHLLTQLTGRAVDTGTAATIREHTDGWAAGVQLAGLTLRSRPDEDLVASIGESDRLIIEYLGEEVLDAQPPERRDALLRLSVADELHPDLVPVLTSGDLGPDVLRRLESESLFITALPEKPGWFTFHALFRSGMRALLRIEQPGVEHSLLVRIATWSRQRDDTATAVEALLRARHWEEAMELVLSIGREAFENGHAATLARWLGQVPAEVRRSSPDAELVYGFTLGSTGRTRQTMELLRALTARADVDAGRKAVAYTFMAITVQFHPPAESAYTAAMSALELLDDSELVLPDLLQLTRRDLLVAMSLGSAGRAELFDGRLQAGSHWLRRMLASPGGQYPPWRIHGIGTLALASALSGRLNAATAQAEEALQLAAQTSLLDHPATGDAHIALALVAVRRGRPGSGSLSLREGVLRASSNARTQLLWFAVLTERLALPADGAAEVALPPTPPPPIVRSELDAVGLRDARHSGRAEPVHAAATEWSSLAFEEVAARLARGDVAAAGRRLQEIDPPGPSATIAAQVQRSLAVGWHLVAAGDHPSAERHLAQAVALAAPEGLVDVFARTGRVVAAAIDELPGAPDAFRREIVRQAGLAADADVHPLPDPLTPREVAILAYLPTRLSNAEIAARGYVSLNTVKTHIARIYRKLDVQSRAAAVDRAAELGLLEPLAMVDER